MNLSKTCTDCQGVDRRGMLKIGGAAIAGVASTSLFNSRFAHAASPSTGSAESFVGELYASLSEEQKKAICLPFDHKDRHRISANWYVTKAKIGDTFFNDQQRTLIDQIVRNVTSEDGYKRLLEQMEDDAGGIGDYSIAMFGEPDAEEFQWEMTGRHLTMRADGKHADKTAFGGPIVYGHGESDPKYNLFHYQTQKANEVFGALDSEQMEKALLKKAPSETAVQLQGPEGKFPGIAVDKLSGDQKQLVESTLKVLLAPYREEDVDEVMAILKSSGGLDQLHLAFYQEGDLNSDKVWDVWRVEGPSLVWHFRGAPHVHAYINIAAKA